MGTLEERVKSRRRKNRRRILFIVLGLLLFFATAALSYYWLDSKLAKKPRKGLNITSGIVVPEEKSAIMILGVDRRADDAGRSDTLMVATVDSEKKAAAILSIPRDTRVKIVGHGYDKINHAYAFGGHTLTRSTVEGLLGIPIDQYILIDTKAFPRIIDAMGGVDIYVEKRMYYEDPWDDDGGLVIDLRKGMQHMDGKTAIQYVRYRDEEGDIGRIARQQKFIKAVTEKLTSFSIFPKIPDILEEVGAAVDTDLSVSQMIRLAGILKDAREKGINTEMVPGTPAYIGDISYWLPDIVELRHTLADILDVKVNPNILQAVEQEAVDYKSSLPTETRIVEEPTQKKVAEEKKPEDKAPVAEKKAEDAKAKAEDKTVQKTAEQDAQKNKARRVPTAIQVEVVNASGIDSAGAEVAGILRRQGFIVSGVSTLTAPYKNTVIITNTDEEGVLGKFSALPFAYSVQINQADGDAYQTTLVIGKNYRQ